MAHRRLFWNIVDKIESRIAAGEYVPGSRLPPERVLAEQFDVSRPTIREAIIALEVRGKVEVKTSSGVYLLEQPPESTNESQVSAFELTQARALIEGEAAALAASNISDDELAALEQTVIAMANGDDPEKADKEFHRIISTSTRNRAVLLAVENFWGLRERCTNIKEAYANVCSTSEQQRMEEHRSIFNALKERNPEAARSAMHAHFNRLINALFDASEAKALEEIKLKNSQTRGLYSLNHLLDH